MEDQESSDLLVRYGRHRVIRRLRGGIHGEYPTIVGFVIFTQLFSVRF